MQKKGKKKVFSLSLSLKIMLTVSFMEMRVGITSQGGIPKNGILCKRAV